MRLTRDFYRPSDSSVEEATVDGIPVEIRRYEGYRGEPCAMVFQAKRAKPDWRLRFMSEEAREARIERWRDGVRERAARTAARRAHERAFFTSLGVGDILVASWGYDQTNVDAYQVVAVHGKRTVSMQPIALTRVKDTGPDSALLEPVPDAFLEGSEPTRYRVAVGDVVHVSRCAVATRWHGKPVHSSSGR